MALQLMVDSPHYRHLYLENSAQTHGFTNPRRGRGGVRLPSRSREDHSSRLLHRLEDAWDKVDEIRDAMGVHPSGSSIEFASDPGFDLVVKSLEDMGRGVRLLNVHVEGGGDNAVTTATVFVPDGERGLFMRKIQQYASEDTRYGKPKNQKLVDSIGDIRKALLESFWRPEERSEIPGETAEWIEVWLRDELEHGVSFESCAQAVGVIVAPGALRFPERAVRLVKASREQLEQLLETCDLVAEFRVAASVGFLVGQLENRDQVRYVEELLARLETESGSDVAVCLLDTGVNSGHSLLKPLLRDEDMHAVEPHWGTHDHDGHGTLMAGTAAYGDLNDVLANSDGIAVPYVLESAKIVPPPPDFNPKALWGLTTVQGIARAEIQAPTRKRVSCLATTATDDRNRGRPSSWSAALDEVISGFADDRQRLVIVSAGNSYEWATYPEANLTDEVHDPAQAWNVVTVGAFTQKTRVTDPTLDGYVALAPSGGLAPCSTTSCIWPPRKWPIKPEVLFEGGNVAAGPNHSVLDCDELQLLSTYHDPQVAQFAPFSGTSAASALAASMAARIQAAYPESWPETVRALIVHSARWTPEMQEQFLPSNDSPSKSECAQLLRVCGYGVPDSDDALYCLSNSLTLVSQATLQPFDKDGGRYVTRDMHLYDLPWPTEALLDLAETPVTMRVTLSYFIEPSPGEIGWENRYRYASHGLRFDVNGPGETRDEFLSRVNEQARVEGPPDTQGAGDHWLIGEARNVGSIHSDVWSGTAAELAASNNVAVYPTVGWWRERRKLGRLGRSARYSLIVSIRTPLSDVDIYTPVAVQLQVPVAVVTG